MDLLQFLEGGAALAVIVGTIVVLYDRFFSPKRRKPSFELSRFREKVEKPVKSEWSIRLLHPDKPIDFGKITLDGVPLPWWDSEEPAYVRLFRVSTGGNVRIPVGMEREGGKVQVLDRDRVLREIKFGDLPIDR